MAFLNSRRILGLAALLLAAAAPALSVHFFFVNEVNDRGNALVSSIAENMLDRANRALDDSVDALGNLALQGASSCHAASYNEMRKKLQATSTIRELGFADNNGDIICNQYGEPVLLETISDEIVTLDGTVSARVVVRDDAENRSLALTWKFDLGKNLTGIIQGETLAFDAVPLGLQDQAVAAVTLIDGTLVETAPPIAIATANEEFGERAFNITMRSNKYPIATSAILPIATIWQEKESSYNSAMIAGGVFGFLLFVIIGYNTRPRRERINEIEAAIENREFYPFYQPTINVQTGELLGCEVLIRWIKPTGQIVPPGAFIGLAEATGLALPMTRALMERVVEDMQDSHAVRPNLKLGINLFDDHFENLDVIDDIKNIFGPSKIAYTQLMFEVTERQPLSDIERARVVIRNMRSLGAKVALDDAGTGHGGLAYLQQLGLDVIKIDKLFIDAIGTDSYSAPIVDSLIHLAESLGMEVIAEGVEEIEQVDYLREKGIAAAQGYLFAKPLPADKYIKLIEEFVPVRKSANERRRETIVRTRKAA